MWQELKFRVSSENALLVEEKLFSSGAAAVTFLDARNQPIFVEETDQMPLWEDICIVSLFSQEISQKVKSGKFGITLVSCGNCYKS